MRPRSTFAWPPPLDAEAQHSARRIANRAHNHKTHARPADFVFVGPSATLVHNCAKRARYHFSSQTRENDAAQESQASASNEATRDHTKHVRNVTSQIANLAMGIAGLRLTPCPPARKFGLSQNKRTRVLRRFPWARWGKSARTSNLHLLGQPPDEIGEQLDGIEA